MPKAATDDAHRFTLNPTPFSTRSYCNNHAGDHASLKQASECIRLLDVDGDGRIGLYDYVTFAARCARLAGFRKSACPAWTL